MAIRSRNRSAAPPSSAAERGSLSLRSARDRLPVIQVEVDFPKRSLGVQLARMDHERTQLCY